SLAKFGIETPATIAAIGREHIPQAASAIGYPVILKHNRAGKGLGVKLIYTEAALQEHLASEAFEDSIDGIMLVQRYIKAPAPFITRVEFIGGKLLYAVRVDTSQDFELCPADACQIEQPSEACPAVAPGDKFQIVPRFEHALIPALQSFLAANDIGVAGIEFIGAVVLENDGIANGRGSLANVFVANHGKWWPGSRCRIWPDSRIAQP